VHAHAVGHVDGLVGVVEADVDVQPEDQLLACDEAQRRDQLAVARAGDDALVLPHGERVGAGRADRQPAVLGGVTHLTAEVAQLHARFGGVGARLGGDLQHRLHKLGLDLPVGRFLEQRLDRVDELVRLAVDDHQLLFDADRVGRAGERVLHGAETYPAGTIPPRTSSRR
jgi:hypothetical protein